MSYVKGEEKVTKTVENRELIETVYKKLKTTEAYGSTRFDSHGYLTRLGRVNTDELRKEFPAIEFKEVNHDGQLTICFRTKGSTGWHGC